MAEDFQVQMKRVNYLTNEIDVAYHEAALKLGLSDSAMLILYTMCNNDGECLLHDIVRTSGMSKQTTNSAIRKLEQQRIVYLQTFQGRRKKIFLTDKGKTLVQDTVLRIIEMENDILASWTEEERNMYVELMERFLCSFQEKMKELS